MNNQAVVIRTDGSISLIPLNDADRYRREVGGWFDVARERNGYNLRAYVNDTGIIDGLEPNAIVSMLFGIILCGDAVIVSNDDEGNDTAPPDNFFTEEFADHAREMNGNLPLRVHLSEIRDKIAKQPFEIRTL
jgi:hypothetical protein